MSNDGKTVFYYVYDSGKEYYCLNDGKKTKIGTKGYGNCYLDRDCKQFLYIDDSDKVRYFRAGDKKSKVLVDDDDAEIVVNPGAAVKQDKYMDEYIIDADSFSDAVMITAYRKCYALFGNTPEPVLMTGDNKKPYDFYCAVTKEGAISYYIDEGDIYKTVYDGVNLSGSIVYESDTRVDDFVCSADLDKLWVMLAHTIYFIEDGADPILVADVGDTYFTNDSLGYDPVSDRCCYIVNGFLNAVDNDPEGVREIADNCHRFSYTGRHTAEPLTVQKFSGNEFLLIGDKIYLR